MRPGWTGSETFTFRPSGEVVDADFVVVAGTQAIAFIDTNRRRVDCHAWLLNAYVALEMFEALQEYVEQRDQHQRCSGS